MPIHRNPILPGFNPDPSLIRVGEDYYLTTSTVRWTFQYTSLLPTLMGDRSLTSSLSTSPGWIYHSKDLLTWTLVGHALTRTSQLVLRTGEPGSGIWAPTLRFHNGMFYMTSCLWTPQQNVRVWPRGFYVATDPWRTDSWSGNFKSVWSLRILLLLRSR